MKIPIWFGRQIRVFIEIRIRRMIKLSDAQAKGYVRTSCEQAGYEMFQ